jgi:hypothetical protein
MTDRSGDHPVRAAVRADRAGVVAVQQSKPQQKQLLV